MKYHIDSNGETRICKAAKVACAISGEEEHYSSLKEARQAFESKQSTFPPKPKKFYHVTTQAAAESIVAEGLKPAIGERSEAIEEAPQVYLFDSVESVNDASWLYEEFDEDEELVLLSVDAEAVVSPMPTFPDEDASWEWTTKNPVNPEAITIEDESF